MTFVFSCSYFVEVEITRLRLVSTFIILPSSFRDAPNSNKTQNIDAVASLNNPPSNQNSTSMAKAAARQATCVESKITVGRVSSQTDSFALSAFLQTFVFHL